MAKGQNMIFASMKKNILEKHNFVVEITFKGQDMVLEEVKFSEVSEFSILGIGQSWKVLFYFKF